MIPKTKFVLHVECPSCNNLQDYGEYKFEIKGDDISRVTNDDIYLMCRLCGGIVKLEDFFKAKKEWLPV